MQSAFHLIPEVFRGVKARALCRPLHFFHINIGKPCIYEPRFVHRGTVKGNCNAIAGKDILDKCVLPTKAHIWL